jgi:chromosome segregation ATPase
MAIASVVQGLVETENDKVFELDSCKGSAWLESIGSFRYEPIGANKPYTVRQEAKKGGDYWYGYRKVAGKLHKKYIGKSSELSTAKLEEIAEALNTPQQPRVTQVADTVTQPTKARNPQVTDNRIAERVTALELQMQALRKSLEALRSELLGKPDGLGNFSELPNPCKVTDSELQIELSNLKTELSNLAAENEKIRADYDALLESSTVVTKKLDQEAQKLRSQLETERADREEVEAQLKDAQKTIAAQRGKIQNLERGYGFEETPTEKILRRQIRDLERQLSDLIQKSATARELPEAAGILNQLKAKRKKSKTDLTDLEVILEILEN